MPVKRQVFQGTAADVAAAVGPHVVRADFFEYPEKVTDDMIIQKILKVRRLLWRALHGLNDNFSFQPSKLREAMAIIWDEQRHTWPRH
eukprot:1914583-Heterocapsa_arctica.AAC.1